MGQHSDSQTHTKRMNRMDIHISFKWHAECRLFVKRSGYVCLYVPFEFLVCKLLLFIYVRIRFDFHSFIEWCAVASVTQVDSRGFYLFFIRKIYTHIQKKNASFQVDIRIYTGICAFISILSAKIHSLNAYTIFIIYTRLNTFQRST